MRSIIAAMPLDHGTGGRVTGSAWSKVYEMGPPKAITASNSPRRRRDTSRMSNVRMRHATCPRWMHACEREELRPPARHEQTLSAGSRVTPASYPLRDQHLPPRRPAVVWPHDRLEGDTVRIAAAQARPVWLDPKATTDKILTWLEDAAAQQVDLVVFPEAFLSGYPYWLDPTGGAVFDDPAQKRAYAAYLDAAVLADGPELALVVEAARDLGIFVYLGVTERGGGPASGTVFCTLVAIDPDLGVVSTHRKLMPTYQERLVWGIGDGHGLRTHRVGDLRVGGLNCWENWMPQARHALYADGEDLHVSVWPGSPRNTVDITRFIALEGRVWSLAVGGLLSLSDVPTDFPLRTQLEQAGLVEYCRGGSQCPHPTADGSWSRSPTRSGSSWSTSTRRQYVRSGRTSTPPGTTAAPTSSTSRWTVDAARHPASSTNKTFPRRLGGRRVVRTGCSMSCQGTNTAGVGGQGAAERHPGRVDVQGKPTGVDLWPAGGR
jgi:nitrilase